MSSSPAQSHKYTPFDTVLDHVARHELDAALEVFGKLLLRPVQVPDESLEGVQLPEEVLRCPGAITAIDPNTHTQVRRQMSTCYLGGIKGLEGVGVVVAGAEVDAVPLHFFFFNTILLWPYTDWSTYVSPFLFVQEFLDSQFMGEKGAGRVYCNRSITMLQSMIIDWYVKWPHAGKVTADTVANHTKE